MLAIVGGKGGCGKTTTALGLARALAAAGDCPLVVDADCDMPNLHTMAGAPRSPGVGALAEGAPVADAVHHSGEFPGVEIVPAGAATGAVGSVTLRRIERQPRPVIVDCPAGATDAVAAPLRVADGALVVSTPERPCRVDAAKTARMARSLGAELRGAVLTRAPPDGAHRVPPLDGECPVLATVPDCSGGVLGDPVGRRAYERLAARLDERNI
ncbi:MAG: MinD/ParA family protein [Haloarculaceae archaeon]